MEAEGQKPRDRGSYRAADATLRATAAVRAPVAPERLPVSGQRLECSPTCRPTWLGELYTARFRTVRYSRAAGPGARRPDVRGATSDALRLTIIDNPTE